MKTKLTFLFFSIGLCLLAQTPKDPAFKTISSKDLLTKTPKESLFEYMKSATIYEVNVRQFSKEGTFEKVTNDLPRLKKMGVDIVWLMPIHPIGVKNRKGTLGSYYAVKDYKGVNPEFGDLSDFKALVKKAHKLKMKVIIDWVANHSSPDNVWLEQGFKEWYTLDSNGNVQPTIGTDWWDVADLNFDNSLMRRNMILSMKYWLTEADIDGFRCDVAGSVPLDFWVEARAELQEVKPLIMLAEAEGPEMHEAFDITYGWELHHLLNKLAQGKIDPTDLASYLEKDINYPLQAFRMYFTSNHDENSWQGTEMERMGSARHAMAVLCYALNGMPLIYNGQETSLDRRLAFFEKDEINWEKMDLVSFYKTLNKLKKNNPAVFGDRMNSALDLKILNDGKLIVIMRKSKLNPKAICQFIINLSDQDQSLASVEFLDGKYKHVFKRQQVKIKSGKASTMIKPWGFMVLERH